MKRVLLVVALAFQPTIVGCAPDQRGSATDSSEDIRAINEVLASHVAAVNAGDIAAILADFADDVVYLPADQLPVFGKDELASSVGPFYDTYQADLEMVAEETVVSGDWAFQWGTLTNTIVARADSDTTVVRLKWLYLYERQPDGRWKIARDMYNANPPPLGE